MNTLLHTAITASIHAGKEILSVYHSDFAIEHKEDKSPLTLADKKSHEIISSYLMKSGYPVLSEEGAKIPYEQRAKWRKLWVVDPLDGTKEFVKRNGEFTVNIALIENQHPVIGVIYVPINEMLYFGTRAVGSFKINLSEEIKQNIIEDKISLQLLIEKSEKLPNNKNKNKYTVVGSRSHMSPETEAFINEIKNKKGDIEMVSAGSSLKLCMIAEGKADIYPRFAPTMEWDTAAGQAILESIHFKLIDAESKEALQYNKENLINPWFIAMQ
jgi:3'(2'), 5'-bisphosphate nucleotidase